MLFHCMGISMMQSSPGGMRNTSSGNKNRKEAIDTKSKENIDHLTKVIQGIDWIDNAIENIYKSIKYTNKIKSEFEDFSPFSLWKNYNFTYH